MAAPSSPYCASSDVATLFPQLLKGGTDFADGVTIPSKATVDSFIKWVSARIDMALSAAGYTVPLSAIDGETWADYQTEYLKMLCTLGAASMVSTPKTINMVGRDQGEDILSKEFDRQIAEIYDFRTGKSKVALRADYRAGSAAEAALADDVAPTTDALYGASDPTRNESLPSLSLRMFELQQIYDRLKKPINWVDQI